MSSSLLPRSYLAAASLLVATCGPTAPAIASEPDPPTLVCRPATPVDVEGPACGGTSVVLQPCAGLLAPAGDVIDGDACVDELETCRLHRTNDQRTHAAQLAAVQQALDAARELAAQHAAELDRVRGMAPAEHWTAPRIIAALAAGAAAVVGGIYCAGGSEAGCYVSLGSAAFGVGLTF